MKLKSVFKTILILFLILGLSASAVFGVYCAKIIEQAPPMDHRALLEKVRALPHYVSFEEMPEHLIAATLAAEDHRFYRHRGIDYIRVVRAALYDIAHGALIQGASTIPMQVSKNHYTDFSRSFKRKILDMHYAVDMEKVLSKEEILECYLNTIGLSRGVEGIGEGAAVFLHKEVGDLSLAESAMLVGITNWPEEFTPYRWEKVDSAGEKQVVFFPEEVITPSKELWESYYGQGKIDKKTYDALLRGEGELYSMNPNPRCKERRDYILYRMKKLQCIDPESYQIALAEKPGLYPVPAELQGSHFSHCKAETFWEGEHKEQWKYYAWNM